MAINPRTATERPRLLVELELEADHFRVLVLSDSYEDEQKLRLWLRRSSAFAILPAYLEHLLDDLDGFDEGQAA